MLLAGASLFVPGPGTNQQMLMAAASVLIIGVTVITFFKPQFWWAKSVTLVVMLLSPALVLLRTGHEFNTLSPMIFFSMIVGLLLRWLI